MSLNRFSIIGLVVLLCFGFSACAKQNPNVSTSSIPKPQQTTTTTNSAQPTPTSGLTELTRQSPSPADLTLDQMVAILAAEGLLSGDPQEMRADLIGAIKGLKYEDQGAEIYQFAPNSEELKIFADGGSVEVEGYNSIVTAGAVNGNLVIFSTAGKTLSQELLDGFKNAKTEVIE